MERVTKDHAGTIIDISKKGCCLFVDRLSFDGFYLIKCLDEPEYKVRIRLERNAGKDEAEILGNICWINSYAEGMVQGFKIGVEILDKKKR